MMLKKKICILSYMVLSLVFFGCKNESVPKPASYLRLDYELANYTKFNTNSGCPFSFDVNTKAIVKSKKNCELSIYYPKMKATIYLTYKPITNNINSLLRDAQKLTYEHVIKADGIVERPYLNPDKKVYGMFYQVSGNAATNSQFYATDSLSHLVTGSIYFYSKPNFDSIMPASSYIQNDMQRLVETLEWK